MSTLNKTLVIITIVIALGLIVTGIVGAVLSFPDETKSIPTYAFEKKQALGQNERYNAVQIDSDEVHVKVMTADVKQAEIHVSGNFYQEMNSLADIVESKIQNGVLYISFKKSLLLQNIMVLGFDLGKNTTEQQSVEATLILPKQSYRWMEVDSFTGRIDIVNVNAVLDLDSDAGDITIRTEEQEPMINAETEEGNITLVTIGKIDRSRFLISSEYGATELYGESVYDWRQKDDDHQDWKEFKQRDRIMLESEQGSILVKE
jgi:hypothetical protein